MAVRDQFLVEVTDTATELAERGLSPAAALLELNALFTAWVEIGLPPPGALRDRADTVAALGRRLASGRARPGHGLGDALTEAFRWSEQRTVTKTATVSLHGNTYEVQAVLVGCKVELVFSPFDLNTSRCTTAAAATAARSRTASPATRTRKHAPRHPQAPGTEHRDRLPAPGRRRPPAAHRRRGTHRLPRPLLHPHRIADPTTGRCTAQLPRQLSSDDAGTSDGNDATAAGS